MENKQWLNGIDEISQYCGCGRTKISELIAKGKLHGVRKWQGSWVIRTLDISANLKYNTSFRRLTKPQKLDIKDGIFTEGRQI